VFAGSGAIVINEVNGRATAHVGISLTFGLIVLVMIYNSWTCIRCLLMS
jgi:aquaporin Z